MRPTKASQLAPAQTSRLLGLPLQRILPRIPTARKALHREQAFGPFSLGSRVRINADYTDTPDAYKDGILKIRAREGQQAKSICLGCAAAGADVS